MNLFQVPTYSSQTKLVERRKRNYKAIKNKTGDQY